MSKTTTNNNKEISIENLKIYDAFEKDIYISNFSEESFAIEGEIHSNLNVVSLQYFIDRPLNEKSVLKYHKEISKNSKIKNKGKYRECNVRIGSHISPEHHNIKESMIKFFGYLEALEEVVSSWRAHNLFQNIHPFEDFNGRVGRAIWLHIFLNKEGKRTKLSFLQNYYYQTLENQRK